MPQPIMTDDELYHLESLLPHAGYCDAVKATAVRRLLDEYRDTRALIRFQGGSSISVAQLARDISDLTAENRQLAEQVSTLSSQLSQLSRADEKLLLRYRETVKSISQIASIFDCPVNEIVEHAEEVQHHYRATRWLAPLVKMFFQRKRVRHV